MLWKSVIPFPWWPLLFHPGQRMSQIFIIIKTSEPAFSLSRASGRKIFSDWWAVVHCHSWTVSNSLIPHPFPITCGALKAGLCQRRVLVTTDRQNLSKLKGCQSNLFKPQLLHLDNAEGNGKHFAVFFHVCCCICMSMLFNLPVYQLNSKSSSIYHSFSSTCFICLYWFLGFYYTVCLVKYPYSKTVAETAWLYTSFLYCLSYIAGKLWDLEWVCLV